MKKPDNEMYALVDEEYMLKVPIVKISHRMHSYIQMQKTRHFYFWEMPGFCLLRRCPNPRRTQNCVLETLQRCSGYAIS